MNAVLLAEDHDVTRFGMDHFLRIDLGVPLVEGYATLPTAIAALKAKPFDLAVIDLGLPGLSSIDQLRNIRLAWPDMRVVVMSGSEERTDMLAALTAGVHGYILKSVPLPRVGEILDYVMAGEIYVPPLLADIWVATDAHLEASPAPETARSQLPPRQRDVLEAICDGLTNHEIAARLGIAVGTVKMHITGLFQTLGVHKRAQAVIVGQKYLRKPKAKR
jgi:DNA-binding NarL/FixJ family response regulator